ncbi:MAG: dihydrodipicolinate synthase family protein [Thermoplasmata archaeon]|nr:dihydrodipicolinate synthase family protein [Thermoplasmata archaeon]
MTLDGLSVPIPTLFGPDGSLDLGRNARYARALSEAHVDHLFVLGSLGEFPSVSDEERPKLVDIVVESVTGKTDVWVGCGAPSTRQAVAYAETAESVGATALVAVPPFYLHPTLESVEQYYRSIHAAASLPLLAYNIPSLVGYALPAPFVHRLGAEGILAGIKDTAGSLSSVESFLNGRPERFAVFPGDDPLASAAIAHGASGAVMGLANIAPKLCLELVDLGRRGDAAGAGARQTLVNELADVVHAGPFPSTGKFLSARLRGADVGYRAPYDPLSPAEERTVLDRLSAVLPRLAPYLGK